MKLKPENIVPTPQDPFDGNLLFRNENAATALPWNGRSRRLGEISGQRHCPEKRRKRE